MPGHCVILEPAGVTRGHSEQSAFFAHARSPYVPTERPRGVKIGGDEQRILQIGTEIEGQP